MYAFLRLLNMNEILNLYSLAENTSYEDKKEFEEKFPNRIGIDDLTMISERGVWG